LAEPTANLVEIKRSYQKHAMLYYPNAVLVMELAAKERDEASKDFA
jgi:curved DNA-binding protein CbpA